MLSHLYLRKGTVYVPTVVRLQTGAYWDIDPVVVEAVTNLEGLQRALSETIERKNVIIPPPPKDKWPPPVLLKYAGVKTWSAFTRGASLWSIEKSDEYYLITGYRTHPDGHWVEDPEQKIKSQLGTSACSESSAGSVFLLKSLCRVTR